MELSHYVKDEVKEIERLEKEIKERRKALQSKVGKEVAAAGIPLKLIADKIGINPTSVGNFARGRVALRLGFLHKVAMITEIYIRNINELKKL